MGCKKKYGTAGDHNIAADTYLYDVDHNFETESSSLCGRDFSKSVSSKPSAMSHRLHSDVGYSGRAAENIDDRFSTSVSPDDYRSDRYNLYDYGSRDQKDEKPRGRQSYNAFRGQETYGKSSRSSFDQYGRDTYASEHRGSSRAYGGHQDSSYANARYSSRTREESSGHYGLAVNERTFHHPTESDMPSLVESETSNFENSWNDDFDCRNGSERNNDGRYDKNNLYLSKDAYVLPSALADYKAHNHESTRATEVLQNRGTRPFANSRSDSSRYRTSLEPNGDCRYNQNYSTGDAYAHSTTITNHKARDRKGSTRTIEVSPGVFSRLRGAEETWRAIQYVFYMPCECSCCSLTIFCIQDADYVLCPECRVVSPMSENYSEGCEGGGVGLGFGLEVLAKWQEEIEREGRVARKQQHK